MGPADIWKYYAITHADHVVCNPLGIERLEALTATLGLDGDSHVLDIACGKGEVLCRLAERHGLSGIGVDLSPFAIDDARARASRSPASDRLQFVVADGTRYAPPGGTSFNLALCLGASWIFDGFRGTIRALRSALDGPGTVLIGEPFWTQPPSPEYLAAADLEASTFLTHQGNLTAAEAEGSRVEAVLVSTLEEWDRYEGMQWVAAERYAAANPTDPDLATILEKVARSREAYRRWGRDQVGWAVYGLRVDP